MEAPNNLVATALSGNRATMSRNASPWRCDLPGPELLDSEAMTPLILLILSNSKSSISCS